MSYGGILLQVQKYKLKFRAEQQTRVIDLGTSSPAVLSTYRWASWLIWLSSTFISEKGEWAATSILYIVLLDKAMLSDLHIPCLTCVYTLSGLDSLEGEVGMVGGIPVTDSTSLLNIDFLFSGTLHPELYQQSS